MGLINRISEYIKAQVNRPSKRQWDSEIQQVSQDKKALELLEFKEMMDTLLREKRYIAQSDYAAKFEQYESVIKDFKSLQNMGMMGNFCTLNGISEEDTRTALDLFENVSVYVYKHNEEYMIQAMEEEREYLDHILNAVDPSIMLDEDQRKVVLTDEDYCLVIAGAGAGKTTTVAAKVKYLVDKKGVDPSQILVVSFTNKAVNELKEKIQGALEIVCPIATFHSTGNAIIHKHLPEEKLNIVDNSRLYFVIRDYFRGSVMQNESVVNKLIMFFASYFDAPYEGDDLNGFFNNIAKVNFSTMRSDLEEFKREVIDTRTKKSVTIQNEVLRSHQ